MVRIETYRFIEGQDYTSFNKIVKSKKGAATRIEYALTTDMAKELCMIENNERGREARRYFIQKEKEATSRVAIALPSKKELALMVVQAEEQIEQLALVNTKQEETIKMGHFEIKQRTVDGMFDANALLSQWNNQPDILTRKMAKYLEMTSTIELISAIDLELCPSRKSDNGENLVITIINGKMAKQGRTPVLSKPLLSCSKTEA